MKLAEFARWAVENGPFEGCELDSFEVLDKALACGILIKTEYDPEKHGGNSADAERGDEWFIYSDEFKIAERS